MVQSEVPAKVLTAYEIARRNGAAALDAATAKRNPSTVVNKVKPRRMRKTSPQAAIVLAEFDRLYAERGEVFYGMFRQIERTTGINHATVLYYIRRYRTERCDPEPGSVSDAIVAQWDDGARSVKQIVANCAERGVKTTGTRVSSVLGMFRSLEWSERKTALTGLMRANIVVRPMEEVNATA